MIILSQAIRTIFRNCGLCSTLSCQRFSIPSNLSMNGSTLPLLTLVVKRWRWTKKKLCSSLSVCTRFFARSYCEDWRRTSNLSCRIRWRRSSTPRWVPCNGSCMRVYKSTRHCLRICLSRKYFLFWLQKGYRALTRLQETSKTTKPAKRPYAAQKDL